MLETFLPIHQKSTFVCDEGERNLWKTIKAAIAVSIKPAECVGEKL
jgi:hypothetical protein